MRRINRPKFFGTPRFSGHRWRILLVLLCFLVLAAGIKLWSGGLPPVGAAAQDPPKSPDGLWQEITETPDMLRQERQIKPQSYRTLRLNQDAMRRLLEQAPMEFTVVAKSARVTITIPLPDGKFGRFQIAESPIMAPELAAKFPEIKTYSGQGLDDPAATARLDWTPAGFHAMILSTNGSIYVDPYAKGDTANYISYYKRDYQKEGETFRCLFSDETPRPFNPLAPAVVPPNGATLRTYRLALAANVEYTQAAGGTVPLAMARMTTTMNRVNGIFEREIAIRMQLVANNNSLIYTAEPDPYTNGNGDTMLNENQANVDNVIGTANYDIGHVFSTGGGGVATLFSPCNAGTKARGVTGSQNPTGDPFDIDFVAHEMGHQFGARHTFNDGVTSNCSNRSASAAYEPGSGSTIMAYAGICTPQNLQLSSNDYYHVKSLEEMIAHITGAGNCATNTATQNTPPVANAGANYTIPRNTPFTLTATATDANADALTYDWEEFDLGPAAPPNDDADGQARPILRSYPPLTGGSRTFPSLQYILNNANVPPATYNCGVQANCVTGEILPSIGRTMNFQATVRDNRAGGGGVHSATMQVTVAANTGPFQVTAPNTAVNWTGGGQQTVTWAVNGTNAAPISTANVKISLSADGGLTFPIVIANNTPNDGSETITVPNVNTTMARIKVEAVGNVFFDISNANFTITSVCAPITISPAQVSNGFVNTAYNQTLTASGGNTPYAFTLDTGLTTTNRFDASGPVNIPDNNPTGVDLPITVSGVSSPISKVTVSLQINHTFDRDLKLQLIGPDATTIDLAVNRGPDAATTGYGTACSPDASRTTFDDAAATTIAAGVPPFAGAFKPDQALSAFIGKSAAAVNGQWKLHVVDNAAQDTGAINCVSIFITQTQLAPGLTLAANGTISGTPTTAGTYNFTVKATDAGNCMGTQAYTLTINTAASCPTANSLSPGNGVVGSQVIISGTNFTGVTGVKFTNNVTATFTVNSATQITATVPAGAVTGPITISKTGCADLQTASFTVCAGTAQLAQVDNGTYASSDTVLPQQALTYFVNRLTPTSYPATLSQVLLRFDFVQAGEPITIVVAPNPTGSTNIDNLAFQTVSVTAPGGSGGGDPVTLDAYNVPTITINSGDFVVGFGLSATVGTNISPMSADNNTPAANRSYKSGSLTTFTQTTGKNYMIRARYLTGCASGTAGLQFYPLARPVRLLDTRAGQGNCDNIGTPINAGTSLTTLARVTCEGITIPATAQAVVGNITVVNGSGQSGFLTVYPAGQQLPLAANLIYAPGNILSNAFTVGLNANGQFNIYGERTIDVIVDISGYYAPPLPAGLYYHPLSKPIRLLDTRAGQGNCDNVGAPITGGTSLTTLARVTCEGLTIPPAAQAIVGNATVINGSGQTGYLTIYPNGVPAPLAANIIYFPGQIISNSFTVSLSAAGEFNIFGERQIDMVIDVAGYYSTEANDANGTGLQFTPLTRPLRILDTRAGQGNCDNVGAPIAAGTSIAASARLTCEAITIPAAAQTVIGVVTVINTTASAGYMTMYPDGVVQPLAANMIYFPNQVLSNAFVVGLNSGTGQFRIFAERTLDAIVDVSGYFAP